MKTQCGVTSCSAHGEHEIDDSETRLCFRHANDWDAAEDWRLGRLSELFIETPDASDGDVWAEMKSEWLGRQK